MPTFERLVAASTDDCWTLSDTTFNLTGDYLYVGDNSALYYDYFSGMRFLNVIIPAGATILSAYLKICSHGFSGTVGETKIDGEAADDVATFSTRDDLIGRPRTEAKVDWNPEAWVSGTWYTSPDIKEVIQEIIDRAEWASGKALVVFWNDDLGVGYQKRALMYSRSWDRGEHLEGPKLEVTYVLLNERFQEEGTDFRETKFGATWG